MVCNHVTKLPCWMTKQYNFLYRICMKKEFSSQGRDTILFWLVIMHGRHDISCKPAITLVSSEFVKEHMFIRQIYNKKILHINFFYISNLNSLFVLKISGLFIFSYFSESSVPYCAPLLERLSNQATGKAEGSWYWPCTCRWWASRQYGALCQVWCVHHIMLYSHSIHNPFCTCTGMHNMDGYNNIIFLSKAKIFC